MRALALDGRLVIASDRTFSFSVSSDRPVHPGGRSTGFGTTAVAPPPDVLVMVVRPIGDYSTYTLATGPGVAGFDPIFDELGFKFRPACFSTDCAPVAAPAAPPASDPPIDYLAKDFDSFRHVAMSWMQSRVPGWTPTSEADLAQVLLSQMSAAADELSDYQDRVMNEAYLATARSRVSLARHARLMDYHVHQGNQATTWVAVELVPGMEIQAGGGGGDPAVVEVWAGGDRPDAGAVVFRGETPRLHHLLGAMRLHTWSGALPALAAGATAADLAMPSRTAAETVRDLIAEGAVEQLVVQEHRNPVTGSTAGADPAKRQLLRLDPDAVEAVRDPVTDSWLVSVAWREEDRLRHDHCLRGRDRRRLLRRRLAVPRQPRRGPPRPPARDHVPAAGRAGRRARRAAPGGDHGGARRPPEAGGRSPACPPTRRCSTATRRPRARCRRSRRSR